jgi:hypothetical protein
MATPALRLIDGRSHDVIAFPRSKVEEIGMDLTTLGVETVKTVEQVWRTAASGDFGAMAQFLSKLEAKGHDAIARGRVVSGEAADAPCVDGIPLPGHGRAA